MKGETIDLFPGYSNEIVRITLFGDEIEKISIHDIISLRKIRNVNRIKIFPAKHYITDKKIRDKAIRMIKKELNEWLPKLEGELEKERLASRTKFDIEMMNELGYCSGIENYSRHFDGRKEGEPPYCLLDFFRDDFLLVIDESHVTIPQLRGMYNGDHTRKEMLVEYGFRLPSSFDNRPLKFSEFEKYLEKVIFVSATPGPYELASSFQVVEQLVRPTGLVDPIVEVRSSKNQIQNLH